MNKILLTLLALTIIAGCSNNDSVTQSNPPEAPLSLTGTVLSSSTVELEWSDGSDNEDRFVIYRSIEGPYEIAGVVNADNEFYLDQGIPSCVTAGYFIVAANESGESTHSNRIKLNMFCSDTSSVK